MQSLESTAHKHKPTPPTLLIPLGTSNSGKDKHEPQDAFLGNSAHPQLCHLGILQPRVMSLLELSKSTFCELAHAQEFLTGLTCDSKGETNSSERTPSCFCPRHCSASCLPPPATLLASASLLCQFLDHNVTHPQLYILQKQAVTLVNYKCHERLGKL